MRTVTYQLNILRSNLPCQIQLDVRDEKGLFKSGKSCIVSTPLTSDDPQVWMPLIPTRVRVITSQSSLSHHGSRCDKVKRKMSLIPDVTEGFLRYVRKLGYHPWLISTQLHSPVETSFEIGMNLKVSGPNGSFDIALHYWWSFLNRGSSGRALIGLFILRVDCKTTYADDYPGSPQTTPHDRHRRSI